jgi:hypothetical protein
METEHPICQCGCGQPISEESVAKAKKHGYVPDLRALTAELYGHDSSTPLNTE